MAEKRLSIAEIAEQLGDKTSTVLDTYTHVLNEWRGAARSTSRPRSAMPPTAPPQTRQRQESQMRGPVEIRRRIARLLARLSRHDDYGELLANGHVVRQVEEADAWRTAIRAQARADRIEGADRR